jgi:hypothetical protein
VLKCRVDENTEKREEHEAGNQICFGGGLVIMVQLILVELK